MAHRIEAERSSMLDASEVAMDELLSSLRSSRSGAAPSLPVGVTASIQLHAVRPQYT